MTNGKSLLKRSGNVAVDLGVPTLTGGIGYKLVDKMGIAGDVAGLARGTVKAIGGLVGSVESIFDSNKIEPALYGLADNITPGVGSAIAALLAGYAGYKLWKKGTYRENGKSSVNLQTNN